MSFTPPPPVAPEGIFESAKGLASASLQYLSVRGRMAAAEARIEVRRARCGILLLIGSFTLVLAGVLAAGASLVVWLASLLESIVAAAGITSVMMLITAWLLARKASQYFEGHTPFPVLREELNQDILWLNRK